MLIGHGYTQSLRAQYVLRVVTCRGNVFTWNSWLFQRRICQIHKPLFPSWYVLEKTKPVYQKILTNKKPWPGFLRFWIISSGVKLLEVVLHNWQALDMAEYMRMICLMICNYIYDAQPKWALCFMLVDI